MAHLAKTYRPLFHAAHYNIIAAQFARSFTDSLAIKGKKERVARTSAIVNLALAMAQRFKIDNEQFDPHKFLDACQSGNTDLFSLPELWEAYAD